MSGFARCGVHVEPYAQCFLRAALHSNCHCGREFIPVALLLGALGFTSGCGYVLFSAVLLLSVYGSSSGGVFMLFPAVLHLGVIGFACAQCRYHIALPCYCYCDCGLSPAVLLLDANGFISGGVFALFPAVLLLGVIDFARGVRVELYAQCRYHIVLLCYPAFVPYHGYVLSSAAVPLCAFLLFIVVGLFGGGLFVLPAQCCPGTLLAGSPFQEALRRTARHCRFARALHRPVPRPQRGAQQDAPETLQHARPRLRRWSAAVGGHRVRILLPYSTEFEVTESLPLLFRMVSALGYVLSDF